MKKRASFINNNLKQTTHGIKHCDLGDYVSILPFIKFCVTGQESSPQSLMISYRPTLVFIGARKCTTFK